MIEDGDANYFRVSNPNREDKVVVIDLDDDKEYMEKREDDSGTIWDLEELAAWEIEELPKHHFSKFVEGDPWLAEVIFENK